MAGTIDMSMMRQINLFARVTKISTKNCFVYNNYLIFAVPKSLVSQAVGREGSNVRRIAETLRKKIKVVAMPNSDSQEQIKKFIGNIVDPITFNKIDILKDSIVINAGRQSKAALIGRGRIREQELSHILKNAFGITKLRIV